MTTDAVFSQLEAAQFRAVEDAEWALAACAFTTPAAIEAATRQGVEPSTFRRFDLGTLFHVAAKCWETPEWNRVRCARLALDSVGLFIPTERIVNLAIPSGAEAAVRWNLDDLFLLMMAETATPRDHVASIANSAAAQMQRLRRGRAEAQQLIDRARDLLTDLAEPEDLRDTPNKNTTITIRPRKGAA